MRDERDLRGILKNNPMPTPEPDAQNPRLPAVVSGGRKPEGNDIPKPEAKPKEDHPFVEALRLRPKRHVVLFIGFCVSLVAGYFNNRPWILYIPTAFGAILIISFVHASTWYSPRIKKWMKRLAVTLSCVVGGAILLGTHMHVKQKEKEEREKRERDAKQAQETSAILKTVDEQKAIIRNIEQRVNQAATSKRDYLNENYPLGYSIIGLRQEHVIPFRYDQTRQLQIDWSEFKAVYEPGLYTVRAPKVTFPGGAVYTQNFVVLDLTMEKPIRRNFANWEHGTLWVEVLEWTENATVMVVGAGPPRQ